MTPSSAPASTDVPADRVQLHAVERRLALMERRVASFEGRLDAVEATRTPSAAPVADPVADFETRTAALEARAAEGGRDR